MISQEVSEAVCNYYNKGKSTLETATLFGNQSKVGSEHSQKS